MEGIIKPKKRKRLIERKQEGSTTFDGNELEKDKKHAKRRKLRNGDISERCDDVKGKDDKGSQEKLAEKEELQKEEIHAKGKNSKKDNKVVERCHDTGKAHENEGLKDKLMDNAGLEKEEICATLRKSKNVALRSCDDVVMGHEKEGQEDKTTDGDGLKKKRGRPKRKKPNIGDVHKRFGDVKVQEEEDPKDGTTENICLDGKDLDWSQSLSDAQVDVLVSIKKLAVERCETMNADKLTRSLSVSALRTIGILLEELAKDHARSLVCTRKSTG